MVYQLQHRNKSCDQIIVQLVIQVSRSFQLNLFATHMQAGNSCAEQYCREKQALQVSAFIAKHSSNPQHRVLFCGDLNMGPVPDATYATHSVHYANPDDARLRHAAYTSMRTLANLQEASADDDVCRFLVRNCKASVQQADMPAGLSDTVALVCTLDRSVGVPDH